MIFTIILLVKPTININFPTLPFYSYIFFTLSLTFTVECSINDESLTFFRRFCLAFTQEIIKHAIKFKSNIVMH